MTEKKEGRLVACRNRKARHDYFIEEEFEAGVALSGSEVKSLRMGKANLTDAYASVRNGELWLLKAKIDPYEQANRANHLQDRERKLLVHRAEINRLVGKLRTKGLTLIPLEIYFKGNWAKVSLGLARGKREYDKRHDIAERDNQRELQRITKRRQQRH
jgi:SsrA-binding protein